MNLEQQVTSLELSKRLKELNVKQESLVYWLNVPDIVHMKLNEDGTIFEDESGSTVIDRIDHIIRLGSPLAYNIPKEDTWSAFTSSELGEMLPHRITLKEGEPFNSFTLYIKKSVIVTDANTDKPIIKYIYTINYECDTTEITGENSWLKRYLFPQNILDENFANALARTLINLIENGMIHDV